MAYKFIFTIYSRLAAACPHESSVFWNYISSEETPQRLPQFLCYFILKLKLQKNKNKYNKKVWIIKGKGPTTKNVTKKPIIPYQQEMEQRSFQMIFIMQLFRFLWNKCCQQIFLLKQKKIKKKPFGIFLSFVKMGWDTKPFAIGHGIGCLNKMAFIIHLFFSFSSFISPAYHELSPMQSPNSKRFLLFLLFFFTVCYSLT